MKLLFGDLETSGVDVGKHGILQLAAILEIDGEEVERFETRMKPFPDQVIEPKALETNGITMEEIEKYAPPEAGHRAFVEWLGRHVDRYNRYDKMFLVAYNAGFDDSFMRAWFKRCGDNYYGSFFCWPPIDVAVLAAQRLLSARMSLPDFKLGTVAQYLGIDLNDFPGTVVARLHDAMFDADLARGVYKKVAEGGSV